MVRKILVGMIAVFIGVCLYSAGYQLGRHLAQPDAAQAPISRDKPG